MFFLQLDGSIKNIEHQQDLLGTIKSVLGLDDKNVEKQLFF